MCSGKTAYTDVEQIKRRKGRLDENENDHGHHHLKKRQLRQQQMDDQVILKREHKKTGKAITNNRQQFPVRVPPHNIKKTPVFFQKTNPVQNSHQPPDIEIKNIEDYQKSDN